MFRFKSFLSNLSNSSSEKALEPTESDSSRTGTLNRLEEALGNLEPERARFLASVALTLGQVAYADMEISEKETEKMLHILKTKMKLPEEQAKLAVSIVSERVLFNNLDSSCVWDNLNELASMEEKKQLIHSLFHLATEDDISTEENHVIRLISDALLLSHKEFIEIRSQYDSRRSLMKDLKD